MSTPPSSPSTSGGQGTTNQQSLNDKVADANKWSGLIASTDPRRK